MNMEPFQDSAVEQAIAHDIQSGSGSIVGGIDMWPKYNNNDNGNLSPPLVDIDVDDDPILGDIRSSEEVGLLGGDIDLAPQYKNNNKNIKQNKISNNNNADARIRDMASKIRNLNQNNPKKKSLIHNIISNQASIYNSSLNKSSQKQQNVNMTPSSNLGANAWCIALFYWIPIRYLCFIGNLALFILPFLDVRFQNISFVEWLLYWYIQIFAIVGLFIESPTWILTRKIQLKIFIWCRILRRTWGRAVFYVLVSFLTFAELGGSSSSNHHIISLSMFAGIYMCILSAIMIVFSMLAAKQYRSMFRYMKYGGNIHGLTLKGDEYSDVDSDKLQSRIIAYFNDLDSDRDGKIGSSEIHSLAEQSLKRNLSNAERYTIQIFLDCSCNGYISKDDFVKQFTTYNNVKFL